MKRTADPAPVRGSMGPHGLAAAITGLYVLFGIAWIAASDWIAFEIATSGEALSSLQTVKGIGYVILTGLLLYLVVFLFTRAVVHSRDELRGYNERLARLNRAHEILRSVGDVLLHGSDDSLLLESTARAVVEHGGFPLVWIALYDHDSRQLTVVASDGEKGLSHGPEDPVEITPDDRSIITHAIYRRQMQAARGNEDDLVARLSGNARPGGWVGAFPLRGTGDTSGVLVIHADHPHPFENADEAMLLSRVADTLALGLDYSLQSRALERLNYHDPVTGVGNRNLVENRLAAALNQAAQRETVVAVLVLDIDEFRAINDAAGHPIGDRVLTRVARILGGVVRPGDTIGRLGNDEFAVLFHEVPRSEDVSRLVNRVADRFPQYAWFDGFEAELTVSIGAAVYPDDAHDPAELLSRAELALHSQAPGQRSVISYYAPEFDRRASEQRALETALRNAELEQEFRLVWQPVVSVSRDEMCAAEVLLRWHNPELGEIEPARFVPLAEQTGRIRTLGQWVLEQACAQAHAWAESGRPLDIAVNIALEQLQESDFVASVQRLLEHYGGEGWHLALELTESQFMADPEPVSEVCRDLRGLGCRIHLDDFGTGYSALNYLVHLPLDAIKLDRTFIQRIADDRDVHAVTETVIALADKLGLEVIAEGVESERQLVIVRQLGARNIQGFLFGRPVPADELLRDSGRPAASKLAK